jgi:hypothetical protein
MGRGLRLHVGNHRFACGRAGGAALTLKRRITAVRCRRSPGPHGAGARARMGRGAALAPVARARFRRRAIPMMSVFASA